MPALHLLTNQSLGALESAFVKRVRELKTEPLAPVNVVVGANLQHIYLRRLLARELGAVANVRFHTLLDFAGEIAMQSRDTEAAVLPEGGEALVLRSVLRERDDGTLPADVAGIPEAVAATGRDLRDARIGPGTLRTALPELDRAQSVAAVVEDFRGRIEGFRDRTGLFERAVTSEGTAIDASIPPGPVLAYGIHDLTSLHAGLLTAVASQRGMTVFLLCDDGSAEFEFTRATRDRLLAAGFVEEAIGGAVDVSAPVQLLSLSERQAEVEEIARRILRDIEEGTPPGQIAVLHRLDQNFDEQIAHVLGRAGIPHYRAAGLPVRRSTLGRAALLLLGILCAEPTRSGLLELLSLPDTSLSWIRANLDTAPASWEALSKEVGLVHGWEQMELLLGHQARLTDEDRDERAEALRERARDLLDVVVALGTQARSTEDLRTWAEFGDWFLRSLAELRPADQESAPWAAISDRVRGLSALDGAGVACSREGFSDAVESAIRRAVVSGGYFQRDGIFIGNVMASRWLRFDQVYLLECIERVFPPLIRQDPLLLDEEREAVNRASDTGQLPLKRQRLLEERFLYELARQSARAHLTVSYARRSSGTGTQRQPSSLFLEQAARIEGRYRSTEELERDRAEWFERLPSSLGFHGSATELAKVPLDESDLRWGVLERWRHRGLRLVDPFWPGLERARALRQARGETRFGPFDGVVGPELVEEANVLGQDLSATSMADYATCPYRFFLRKVLGIRSLDEPEDTLEIAPKSKGTLVHRILERLVLRYLETSESWVAFLEHAEEELGAIEEEEFASLSPGTTGVSLSWAMVVDEIRADVRTYLETEREVAAEGWEPIAAEEAFERIRLGRGTAELTIRGKADRVDQRDGELRVIDYKTGMVRERADGYQKGQSLQLPLYMEAASEGHETPLELIRAEYHYVSRRGRFSRVGLAGATLSGDETYAAALGHFRDGIASGAFFYVPGYNRRNCSFCDFSRVCHPRVEQNHTKKMPGSRDLSRAFDGLTGGRS